MREEFEWRHEDFSGGMVYRASPGNLRQNEVEWLENFDIFEQQYATKRYGFERLNETPLAGAVQGMIEHYTSDGTRHFLVSAGGSIYRQDNVTGDFDEVESGFASGAETRTFFVAWDDDVVILNGVDVPQMYDSSVPAVTALGGSPPTASFGATYYRHLFLNSVSEPIRVYYSETNDPEDGYSAKNYFFDAGVGDASAVTGFLTRDQELLIGKLKSITAVRGNNPRDFSQSQNRAGWANTSGVLNAWSFFDAGGDPWFLDTTGVFSLRAPFDIPEQSYWVDGLMDRIASNRIGKSFGMYLPDRNQALFWVPRAATTDDFTNMGMVGHVGRGRGGLAAWSIYTGLVDITAGCVGAGAEVGDILFLGDADGFVYRRSATSFLDVDEPVAATLRTMHHTFRRPKVRKVFRETVVELEAGVETNLQVRLYIDRVFTGSRDITVVGGGPFILGLSETGDALGGRIIARQRYQHDEDGIRCQVEIVSDDDLDCRVSAIEQRGYKMERRGRW